MHYDLSCLACLDLAQNTCATTQPIQSHRCSYRKGRKKDEEEICNNFVSVFGKRANKSKQILVCASKVGTRNDITNSSTRHKQLIVRLCVCVCVCVLTVRQSDIKQAASHPPQFSHYSYYGWIFGQQLAQSNQLSDVMDTQPNELFYSTNRS